MPSLKALIISDVHATSNPNFSRDTRVMVSSRMAEPIQDLLAWINDNKFTADYVLTPGDISNRSDTRGLAHGWDLLNQVAKASGAQLIGVPGNHDIATFSDIPDPRRDVKALPDFPTPIRDLNDDFWRLGWALVEEEDHRVLLIDSTFDFPPFPAGCKPSCSDWQDCLVAIAAGLPPKSQPHSVGCPAWTEWTRFEEAINRGGLSQSQFDDLRSHLGTLDTKLNVALIHHHPQEHQLRQYLKDTYGPMRRGDDLVELLDGTTGVGRWVIIHGHKHIPQLSQAVVSSSSGPLVLCAASLSAKLWDEIHTITRNQFHILQVTNDPLPHAGSIRGNVTSYYWGVGQGWKLSHPDGSGLPAHGGFGCAEDSLAVALRIHEHIKKYKLLKMTVDQLQAAFPEMFYLLPSDVQLLATELAKRQLHFTYDEQQRITELVDRT